MDTVIIKYNAGNIQSVLFALERIGVQAIVTDDVATISAAKRVIFPGVGEASTAMAYLRERNLDSLIRSLRQPVLGICLGMQLLCEFSEENNTACIGVFEDVAVRSMNASCSNKKIPQIGWNNISNLKSELFKSVKENSYCYFVHGYYASLNSYTIATTDYINEYSSALCKDNFYGVQFHPEKSADVGEQILKNFMKL
ncbi:MAG TPA: imidazole glycerol phosphate synthase subunit HisH [Chitinophagaceae bacterium]